MTRHLNVLIAESHPGLAESAVRALERAGHTTHRCYEPDQRSFPCRAFNGQDCPLDGPIDVAFVSRLPMSPRPTPLEDGVRCALRAGVPLVEEGSALYDPFAGHVDEWVRPGDQVTQIVEKAAEHRYDPLRRDVLHRIERLLQGANVPVDRAECRVVPKGHDLAIHITIDGPGTKGLDQALAVRALDAVRSAETGFGQVDVHVHHREGCTDAR